MMSPTKLSPFQKNIIVSQDPADIPSEDDFSIKVHVDPFIRSGHFPSIKKGESKSMNLIQVH